MTFRKYHIIAVALLITILFEACSVGKNYKRPQTGLPDAYRNAPAPSGDTTTAADLAWKDFFADTTLQRLIDRAVTKNFDMLIALRNIESARQTLKQSNAAFGPDLDFRIAASSNIPSANSLNGISINQFIGTNHVEDFTAGLVLTWEIDIWGKIRRQKEAAQAEYLRTWEAVRTVQTRLVSDVAAGYYNLLMLDAQLETAKKNLALNDSILQMTRLMKEVGQVTELAVQLVESQQQSAMILIPQLEQRIAVQENALHILAGELPDAVERTGKLEEAPLPDDLAAGLPLQIISRRPDVKAAELGLRSANARVGVAQASMYPSLVINLSGGLNSFTAGNWFNVPGALFGTFAGGITQPLFRRRQLKTQFELAKIEREKSAIEFQRSVIVAVGEVSDALVRVEKLKVQQQVASQRVQTLRGAVSNATLLFETGMADYLEVITAQANLLQGELESAGITYNLYTAKIDLYRSLGGGWK